jgi:heat-inducible transcriptional repressor
MARFGTQIELTARQGEILRLVVEEYVETGQPVGSKSLVERTGLAVSPSTVRHELAELERLGLLTHPHTSAGRVPTEQGYRYFVDRLLDRLEPRPSPFELDLSTLRREIEDALQQTTEMLSQVTRLLAVVSAPAPGGATVRHVEVLLLQPHVVMVVVITSTGGVTKRAFAFEDTLDPGLVAWAAQYLNEELTGLQAGTTMLRRRLEEHGLSQRERAFLDAIRPVFTELAPDDQRVYVGGAASLLERAHGQELSSYSDLFEILEKRAALLDVLARSLDTRRPFVRVGDELEHPSMRDLALVGASYGLANRALGAVSLLGPLRMDYDKAIRSVRSAAYELSRFGEEVYAED